MTEETAGASAGPSKDEKKLAAFLKSDRVPSNEVEVTLKYDPTEKDGVKKYKTCVILFARNVDAYDRYMSSVGIKAAKGVNVLIAAAGRQFILDTVIPNHRELIDGFLTAYPGEAIVIAGEICGAYTVPGGMEEVKNG